MSDGNRAALGWVERWPGWPAPALILHGPPGCGKTHLARVWQDKANAVALENAGQMQDADCGAALIDDVEKFLGDGASEAALFHLYNIMKEKGGHLLITASKPPAEWKIALPDLKSRLLASPAAAISSPDDALMSIVLMKAFSDRQIAVSQEVIAFLVPRVERSFSALRDLAAKIDEKALAEKRPVTVPLARELLTAEKSVKLF